jgi:pilus assembly protein CpaE
MSRHAVLVGEAAGSDESVVQTLARFSFSRVTRVEHVTGVLDMLGAQHIDLVIVPLDALDEPLLARLDRAIRMEKHTAVMGTAPATEPELMLRAMRAGIQEFLVRPLQPTELAASLERLLRRTVATTIEGQVYAVYSAKGGTGASSVAVNVATALAGVHKQGRVALCDLVVTGGEDRLMLNLNPPYDLADVADKADRIDGELLNSVLVQALDGVWLLAGSERPEAEEVVDAGVITSVVNQLKQNFNFTLLDCEHMMNDRTLAALDAADRVLLVTQLSVPALRAAQRALGICRRLGYPDEKLCVIINRFQSGDVVTPAEASEVLKAAIFYKLPNDYKASSEALTRGIPVAMAAGQSKLAWAYTQLATKLSGAEALVAAANGAKQNGSHSRLRTLFSRKKG